MRERRLRAGSDLKRNKIHNGSAAQGRHGSRYNERLEIRRNGSRQTVPYYIHLVHNNRDISGAFFGSPYHCIVAAPAS